MFCTNCGTNVPEGNAHCTSCGTRVDGVGAVAYAARSAYAGMDDDFKKSLFLGGGAMACSVLAPLLANTAGILLIILVPAAIILGILALNAGRELTNRTGYYLGMIGLSSGTVMFYMFLFAYVAKAMAASAAQSAAGSLMGSMIH